jgi:hypothetical protein
LECLQHPSFRQAFLSADSCIWLHQRQYRHWDHFRREHVGVLDELLEMKQLEPTTTTTTTNLLMMTNVDQDGDTEMK